MRGEGWGLRESERGGSAAEPNTGGDPAIIR